MDDLVRFVGGRWVELGVKVRFYGDINRDGGNVIGVGVNAKTSYKIGFVFGRYNGYGVVFYDNPVIINVDIMDPEFDPMDVVWLGYLVHVANRLP